MSCRTKVPTCLWFESGCLEAAEFYGSLLPWSAIDAVYPHGETPLRWASCMTALSAFSADRRDSRSVGR